MVIRKLAIYSFAGIILSLNLALNANTLKKNNFIGNKYGLTKNKNFNEVLNDAKDLGYAESNPSADLNGDDVASKLKILSSLCFNSFLNNPNLQ